MTLIGNLNKDFLYAAIDPEFAALSRVRLMMDYLDFVTLVFLIYISALPQVVSQAWDAIYGYFTPNFIKRAKKIQNAEAGLLAFLPILVLHVLSFFFHSSFQIKR